MEKKALLFIRVEPGTRRPFALCEDERALQTAGLPSYASSLHRYLWNGPGDGAGLSGSDQRRTLPPGVQPRPMYSRGFTRSILAEGCCSSVPCASRADGVRRYTLWENLARFSVRKGGNSSWGGLREA